MSKGTVGPVGAERAGKKPAPVPGVEAGDHVYVQHPKHGPIAVKVLAKGADGLTGECDQGNRYQCGWDTVLGTKSRMLHKYTVVDRGAEGAILADDKGKRRYLEVGAHESPEISPAGEPAELHPMAVQDDPLMGGMGRLRKAMEFPAGMVLFSKAAIANRPGLALQDVTDRAGHQTKRWVRQMQDQAKPRDKAAGDEPAGDQAPMKHGDVVAFRHGDVQGQGKIVASGADGVTLHDDEGRQHQVRHEHLTGPAADGGRDGQAQPNADAAAAAAQEPAGAGAAEASPETPPPLFAEAEMKALPGKAAQPVKTEAELFAKAPEALEHLKEWLDKGKGIASQLGYETMAKGMDGVDWKKPGGMLFIAPLKGAKRAAEKVASDYGGDWSQLLDPVRCSIAVDTYDQVKTTLEALKKGGLKLARQPKDRFHKALPVGYRDLMLNVTFPNGVIGEVQLHVKPMLAAKEEGHHHYEVERTLNGRAELTADDEAALRASIEAQTKIYGDAWKASVGGAASGGEMHKAMSASGYSYFEHENAKFRRANRGLRRAVDDVLIGGKWQPYKGADKLRPAVFGDEIADPLGGGGQGRGDGGEPMAKAILFLKAAIPGGAAGDLFAQPAHVNGHMRGATYVAPYDSTRHKKAAPAETVPGVVHDRVRTALGSLHDVHSMITTARKMDGALADPHHERSTRARHADRMRTAYTTINTFRDMAKQKGIDAEAVITQHGGIPDLDATGPIKLDPPKPQNDIIKVTPDAPGAAPKDGDSTGAAAAQTYGPDVKHFYVSAVDGSRKHLVAGPYASHDEARARVEDVRKHADSDPRAHFMAWGTAGSAHELKTPLGASWAPAAAAEAHGYIARATSGKKTHATKQHPTREAAAEAAFAAMPKAKSVQTARARNGVDSGNDIRFHTKPFVSMMPKA